VVVLPAKGSRVLKRLIALGGVGLLLAGCGTPGASQPPSPTPAPATAPPTAQPTATSPQPQPTPTVVISRTYQAFVTSMCSAFAAKNAQRIVGMLPYYQYNSGLRWGRMGDGEGYTVDPSEMNAWLAASNVRCVYFTPDDHGHGTVLARGWSNPGPWGLIELDVYPGGHWKINDFTFGRRPVLYPAMQTAGPALRYRT
jgi:hypothetical protein